LTIKLSKIFNLAPDSPNWVLRVWRLLQNGSWL